MKSNVWRQTAPRLRSKLYLSHTSSKIIPVFKRFQKYQKQNKMVHKIALFNHKGGVSKTTTTFNLGWMLASKGKRVILVDTDP
ncbi:MAG: ParA family protein, partial [Nostoc sp.]